MSVHTRSQKLAQAAYMRVADRIPPKTEPKILTQFQREYRTLARKFPALIHTCGLAQAVAFALAKQENQYIGDLEEVLKAVGHTEITNREPLEYHARTQQLSGYLRLSRDAINAASWLKRYVEAAAGGDE